MNCPNIDWDTLTVKKGAADSLRDIQQTKKKLRLDLTIEHVLTRSTLNLQNTVLLLYLPTTLSSSKHSAFASFPETSDHARVVTEHRRHHPKLY